MIAVSGRIDTAEEQTSELKDQTEEVSQKEGGIDE